MNLLVMLWLCAGAAGVEPCGFAVRPIAVNCETVAMWQEDRAVEAGERVLAVCLRSDRYGYARILWNYDREWLAAPWLHGGSWAVAYNWPDMTRCIASAGRNRRETPGLITTCVHVAQKQRYAVHPSPDGCGLMPEFGSPEC